MFVDTPGYVLKPIALRQKTIENEQRYRIVISVISAQRIPLSTDTFVEVSIDGISRKTKSTKCASPHPYWNEAFEFIIDCTPSLLSLTFLRLEIRNRVLIAQWMRPLAESPHGYHHLPLYDSLFSRYVFATLFVRIVIDTLHNVNP